MKKIFAFASAVLLVLALTPFAGAKQREYDSVVRFHIRANSDSVSDQRAKIAVRNEIVAYTNSLTSGCADASEALKTLSEHFGQIENLACHILRTNGKFYDASAYVSKELFPEKEYGDAVFPSGIYTAVRIDLGSGEGQNFWCVLFPPVCLSGACTTDVLDNYGVGDFSGEYRIKFRIWEDIKKVFSRKCKTK